MRGPTHRSPARGRRLAAAVAAGMALPLMLACWSAHADVTLPNPAGLTTTIGGVPAVATGNGTASPTPTPCPSQSPSGLPAPTAVPSPATGLLGTCTAPPTPSVSGTPTLGSNPGTPGDQGTGPGGTAPKGGVAAGGVDAGGSAVGSVVPGSTTAGTSVANSMAFGLPLGLLTAPANVGIENPTLRHFLLETAATSSASDTPSTPAPPVFSATPLGALNVPGPLLASVLVPSLLITVGLILARRLVALRLRRVMELTAVPFGTAAALSLLLLVPKALPSATADLTAGPAAVSTAPPAVVQVANTVPAGSPAWLQLTAIERSVAGLENQLQNATTVTPQMGQDDRPPHPVQLASTNIATAPPSAAVQLENALQTEYSFYVSLVQHPDQQQALMSDLRTASAGLRDVVVYDLQAVQTQLAQDAAIQSAQQSALAGTGPVPTTLLAPEVGAITQGFGATDFAMEPPFTFGGVTYPHFHTGVDIAAPLDTPVAAAADGVVVIGGASTDLEGNLVGYGNYVVIAHAGKMVTLYGHLDKLLVHAGQPVHAGDVIALEGSTGNSTGPHLHFEVRVDGLLADPMRYLGTQIHKQ